jgi:hypothetical protein
MWTAKLQTVYSSFDEFKSYCSLYNIHKRLGYSSISKCWADNPKIQGSVNPNDLKVVKEKK